MATRMLIDATHSEEIRVVTVKGTRLEEFDFETSTKQTLKGNIYLAKVTRVEPSLQAAFVEYGGNRHGFLAFGEIHPDYYQIPVADRQKLLARQAEEEAAALAADEAEAEAAEAAGEPGAQGDEAGDHEHPVDEVETIEPDEAAPIDSGADELAGDEAAHADLEIPPLPLPPLEVAAEEPVASPPAQAEATGTGEAVLAAEIREEPADQPDTAGLTPIETEERHDGEDHHDHDHVHDHGHDHEHAEPEAAGTETTEQASTETVPGESRPREQGRRRHGRGERGGDRNGDRGERRDVEAVGGDAFDEVQRPRRERFQRHYKIQEVIKRRQILLVQVVKEERGNKGAALTTYLSLAGRYCVLMPNTARGGGISRKIQSAADRKRLKSITAELEVPEGMGVIVRTAGMERSKAEIKRDFEYLLRTWDSIRELTLQSTAPCLVYEEANLIKRSIRDLYNKDIDEILVEGEDAYRAAKDFMKMLMPSHAKRVQPYRDRIPLFHRFQVETQLDSMFSPTVQLKSGGYIVINPTEALVSIDVNSGKSTREHNIEETAYKTNLEAAEEIGRQLRLRDLAGLVVIDFIDMEEGRNIRNVERRLKDCLKSDRARIQVGRISAFGLMEMSRQRLRPSLIEASTQPCPHCIGRGYVRSTESTALYVLRAIEEEGIRDRSSEINVFVATNVAIYLLNHKREAMAEIERRYGMKVVVAADDSLVPPDHRIDRIKTRVPGEFVRPIEPEYKVTQDDAFEEDAAAEAALALEGDEEIPAFEESEESDAGEPREARAPREPREAREPRAPREREPREPRQPRDPLAVAEGGEAGETAEAGQRRRRRRRRRRGGEGRDNRPEGSQTPNEDGTYPVDVNAHAEESAEPGEPGHQEDGAPANGDRPPLLDENGRPQRRRGRRGGRRRRRNEGGTEFSGNEFSGAELPPRIETPAEIGASFEYGGGYAPDEPQPEVTRRETPHSPSPREQMADAEAARSYDTAPAYVPPPPAPEPVAAPAATPPEPVAAAPVTPVFVSTEPVPDEKPKRGWWRRR